MGRFSWIIVIFVLLMCLLAFGLTQDPSRVPSPLIGKPLPQFTVAMLKSSAKQLTPADLQGPAIINVWASWCRSCVEEHPLLLEIAQGGQVPIYGVNYKDLRADAKAWLAQRGDPYTLSLFDFHGELGMELGVYAVPETFVIDKQGIIRYKHVGPLRPDTIQTEIYPLLEALRNA